MIDAVHRFHVRLDQTSFDEISSLRKRFVFVKKASAAWEVGDWILLSGPSASFAMRVSHVQDMAPKLHDYAALSLMTGKEWYEWPDNEKEAAKRAVSLVKEVQP